jgi:hypothetical protein
MPSGEVITLLPVPLVATATSNPSSGAQQMLCQLLFAALVLVVHVMPSGEVITLLPVPLVATATSNPSSGAQQMLCQLLSAALVLVVHVMPSGEVITLLPVPLVATATSNPSSGAQQMLCQPLSSALVLAVHTAPVVGAAVPPQLSACGYTVPSVLSDCVRRRSKMSSPHCGGVNKALPLGQPLMLS